VILNDYRIVIKMPAARLAYFCRSNCARKTKNEQRKTQRRKANGNGAKAGLAETIAGAICNLTAKQKREKPQKLTK